MDTSLKYKCPACGHIQLDFAFCEECGNITLEPIPVYQKYGKNKKNIHRNVRVTTEAKMPLGMRIIMTLMILGVIGLFIFSAIYLMVT